MTALRVAGLRKEYGGKPALADLSLEVKKGSFTVLLGPPKCGKSVLFRLLVGLEVPDAGTIELAGKDITGEPPRYRRIGYVPQSFALYPHLSVRENIAYPMRLAKAPAADIDAQVARAVDMLSIGHLLDKTPDQLSGGEKQRTALARGLLNQADFFVLDDPLVGLDYKLRERLVDDLKRLRAELNATFLYATSDSIEALRLASELAVLDDGGRLLQQSDPLAAYHQPTSARAMELVGFPRANLLSGSYADGKLRAGPLSFAMAGEGQATVGFRPEDVKMTAAGGDGIKAKVLLVEDLGSEMVVHLEADGSSLLATSLKEEGVFQPELDADVTVAVAKEDVRVFATGAGS